MDGTYIGSIDTPMGKIEGKVRLATNGNQVTGTLEAMGKTSEFSNGVVNGNTCTFKGAFSTMLGKIQYQVIGQLEGDILNIIVNTNKGKFSLQGKKVS